MVTIVDNEGSDRDFVDEMMAERAQRLLSRRFGGSVTVIGGEVLPGSGSAKVVRTRLASNPYVQQRSVIVKHSPTSDDPADEAAFLREVVAYQFTTTLPPEVRPGPTLLAYDLEERLLVVSDCGNVETLSDLMEYANADQRYALLRRLGRAIGLLHRGSAGREDDFTILFSRMLARHPESAGIHRERDEFLGTAVISGLDLLVANGIPVTETVRRFAVDAQRRLMSGQHRAFTPFDLSPDNIVYSERPEFLDYEWAGFRDATFDVACVLAGFPQFVFSKGLSDAEADLVVEAWRQEVCSMWPNVNNAERLKARIVTALVGWALLSVWYIHCGAPDLLGDDADGNAAHDYAPHGTLGWSHQQVLASVEDFEELRQLACEDVCETFDALRRFALRGSDPRFPEVVAFADAVIERYVPPEISHSVVQ